MSTKAFRRLVAKIGIAAVLFTQLAVAAYECPVIRGAGDGVRVVVADDMRSTMPGCEETDIDNPNLCLQHCQAGNQSVQTMPQLSVPAIAVVHVAIIEPIQPASGIGISALSVLMERETSPPPLIRFGVLRI